MAESYTMEFTSDQMYSSVSNLTIEQVREIIELKRNGEVYVSQDRNDNIMIVDLPKIVVINFTKRAY